VQKPYEGRLSRLLCFGMTSGKGQAKADRDSEAPAKRRRPWSEARERRSGEILTQVFAREPWKGETQGRHQLTTG
jgi:hypothetical protein